MSPKALYYHSTLPGLLILLSLCGACNDNSSSSRDASTSSRDATSPGNDSGTMGTGPCTSVFDGTYLLKDQAALNALAEYCEVTGALSV
jgi:hypothetical protein